MNSAAPGAMSKIVSATAVPWSVSAWQAFSDELNVLTAV